MNEGAAKMGRILLSITRCHPRPEFSFTEVFILNYSSSVLILPLFPPLAFNASSSSVQHKLFCINISLLKTRIKIRPNGNCWNLQYINFCAWSALRKHKKQNLLGQGFCLRGRVGFGSDPVGISIVGNEEKCWGQTPIKPQGALTSLFHHNFHRKNKERALL